MTEGFKGRAKRLERASRENMIAILQPDGTYAKFPQSELKAAYLRAISHALGRGEPEHPVLTAMRNSPDPHWRDAWSDLREDVDEGPPEDLSE